MFGNATPTARSRLTAVVEAPIEPVWALIRDFGAVANWHPMLRASEIEGGGGSMPVGCVRRLVGADGQVFRERLVELSARKHRLAYQMLEPPLPTAWMVNEVALETVTEIGATYLAFSSTYAAAGESAAEVDRINTQVFQAAVAGLRARLGGPAGRPAALPHQP